MFVVLLWSEKLHLAGKIVLAEVSLEKSLLLVLMCRDKGRGPVN